MTAEDLLNALKDVPLNAKVVFETRAFFDIYRDETATGEVHHVKITDNLGRKNIVIKGEVSTKE